MKIRSQSSLALALFLLVCHSGVCQMDDYRFWITKMSGGNGYGKISSVNTDGSDYEQVFVFEGALKGRSPIGEILQASDGYLYGVTHDGGLYDWGVIFRMNADGSSYSVLHNFTKKEGANPSGGLIESFDGKLYGVSTGTQEFPPVVFSFDKPSGNFEIVHEFPVEPDLSYPISILQASNGNLYGICERGIHGGSLFKINLATGEFDNLADFTALFPGKLLEGSDGMLYGSLGQADLMSVAGASIYRINLDGSGFTTIFDFGSIGSSNPARQMIEGPDGYLYGTASPGTANGLVYKVKKDGSDFAVLKEFSPADGYFPMHGVILASDGFLYGFTTEGAGHGKGAFYRLHPDGSDFEIVKDLDSDFTSNSSAPVQTSDGNFYTTSRDGNINGLIYKLLPSGAYSAIDVFSEAIDHPYQLLYTKSNKLLGVNQGGGAEGQGGIFELEKDGSNVLTVVHENSLINHSIFRDNLAEDNDGNFFSAIYGLGNSIGKLSPDYSFTKIFDFPDNTFTWANRGTLFFASDEFLYGITAGGGTYGNGSLYRLRTDGSEFSIQHSFEESTIDRQPIQFEFNGYLYGVCNGGVNGRGSIYRFNLATKDFDRIFDLTSYFGTTLFGFVKLLKNSDGMIYGLATSGGAFGNGLIFKIAEDGSGYEELRSFSSDDKTEGYQPTRILEGTDSLLYGITALGGDHDAGVIFSMKRDGSGYRKIFDMPEEPNLRFLDEIDINLIPKNAHEISFKLPSNTLKMSDGPVTLTASSDAGLPVTFSSSDTSVAKIDGSTLVLLGVGEVTITAQQRRNDFYTHAAKTEVLNILKGDQQLTFDPIESKAVSDNNFDLSATSDSGLPVSYSTPSDNIAIEGNAVTILAAGRATIIARQDGDANYNAALPVEQSLCINPAKPVISDDRLTSNTLLLTSSNDVGNHWYLNGAEMVDATEKTLTIVEDGTYTVNTTVDDCVSELSDAYASVITALGPSPEWSVLVYPNPAGEKLSIEVTGNPRRISINIIDVTGRTLVKQVSKNQSAVLDFGFAPKGLYFVQLMIEGKLYVRTVVKK